MENVTSNFKIDFIQKGVEKAQSSMSNLLGIAMDYSLSQCFVDQDSFNADLGFSGKRALCLSSKIFGEIEGMCFLFFKNSDIDLVQAHLDAHHRTEEWMQALLLEMKNILTANVVTEIANALEITLYGAAPSQWKTEDESYQKVILAFEEHYPNGVSFYIKFSSEEIDFSPEFVWILDANFTKQLEMLKP